MQASLTLNYLWKRRSFISSLVYKDIKIHYARSTLGLAWIVIEPLMLVGAMTIIFEIIGRQGLNAGEVAFPVFFFSGVVPWNYMRHAFTDGSRVFIAEAVLIKKYNFPREVLAVKAIAVYFIEFMISGSCLLLIVLGHGHWPQLSWLWIPPILVLQSILGVGLVLTFGSLNVYIRDVERFNMALASIAFWMTPVVFRLKGDFKSKLLLYLNPASGLIEAFREALLDGKTPKASHLLIPALWAIVFCAVGLFLFRKLERGFADVV